KSPRDRCVAQLTQMIGTMRHEPSYVSGTLVDEGTGVYAGWVARAGSFASRMPTCNERDDLTLLFSGEEYATPESVRQLRDRGHEFDCNNPASYLVHLSEDDAAFPA